MGTKYSTVTISGYNAAPPADDGSQVSSNQITWAKHKLKLGDPIKTAVESINSSLVTALDTSVRAVTSNDTLTAADHLKTIQCTSNSAGFSISLGDAVTMAAGYIVTVHNRGSSTGDVTVNLASSTDSINNVTNGVRLLPPGSALTFVIASPTSGYLITGSDNVLKSPFWVDVSGVLKRMTIAGDINFPAIAAKGDLLAGSGAGALTAVTAGSSDAVLMPDSSQTGGVIWRSKITQIAPVTTTGVTSVDFNTIPAWVKRITVFFNGTSLNSTAEFLIQLGDSGGIEPTGYTSSSITFDSGATGTQVTNTTGFIIQAVGAATTSNHKVTLELISALSWDCSYIGRTSGPLLTLGSGRKSLTAALDRVRITTTSGTDTFDAGTISISLE